MKIISSGIEVLSGVTSTGFEVIQEGILRILTNGRADEVAASSGGAVVVSSGGILYICQVGNGGTATVTRSGYAQDITIASGGLFVVSSGGTAHQSLIQSGGTQIVHADVMVVSATVQGGGELIVSSGGYVLNALVHENGAVKVWSQAIVEAPQVSGTVTVNAGARVNSAKIRNMGSVDVLSSGYVYRGAVSSGGSLIVENGGIVNSNTVHGGGMLEVLPGGSCFNANVSGGSCVVNSGASAANTTVRAGGTLDVRAGGTATTVRENGGYVSFEEGADVGFAANTFSGLELGDASATVHSGTTAVRTVLNGGSLEVFSGGSAAETNVGSGGRLEVKSGGMATDVIWTPCVGTVSSAEGAQVTFASAYAGVYYGAHDELVSSASVLESLTVGEQETMYVFSGGTAGDLRVQSGGRVAAAGGVFTGSVTVEAGADVSAGEGAELNFDLRQTSAGAGAFVNDLSAIRGSLLHTLTVNGDLKAGKYDYSLADGAGDFSGAITVRDAAGETLGSLNVGQKTTLGGVEYLLILAASNLSVTVEVPDVTPPTVNDIRVTPDTPTNQDVLVTAVFSDDSGAAHGYYHLEGEAVWSDYLDGVVVARNTTVYLKAVDAAGLESEVATVAVTNIDKDPPVITLDADPLTPARRTTLAASTEPGVDIYYSRDGGAWTLYAGTIEVTANGAYEFTATDAVGNTGTAAIVFDNIYPAAPQNPVGTPDRVSWDPVGAERYILEYSTDDFAHGIRVVTAGSAVDMFTLPAWTWQWRVRADDSNEWATGADIVSGYEPGAAEVVRSDSDGEGDIFFAAPDGVWDVFYSAMHAGSRNDWSGTGEIVSAAGRGRIRDLYFGSDDLNVLYLTDGANGDAIFIDDAYTELPEAVTAQSRLAMIREIRAGAGNDIVDLTSQSFEYTGPGVTIRGGDGDDTLWANKGSNMLFGDAGDDRIVGASGDDVIAGGIGNDRMHGGGGNDVFTFCDNWGIDNVEQLATGSVTLWFVESKSQITASELDGNSVFTNAAGTASVTVKGFALANIVVKYGDDGSDDYAALASAGAFLDATTERIFEESGKGLLASL